MTIVLPFGERWFWVGVIVLALVGLSVMAFYLGGQRARQNRLPQEWQMKSLLGFAGIIAPIWAALLVLTIWHLFDLWWQGPPMDDAIARHTNLFRWLWPEATGNTKIASRLHYLALVGLMTALGGLVGLPLAVLRVLTTERQTRTAEQGHITDRIAKAVELIGTDKVVKEGKEERSQPNIEVRIGGLFALERIARDSLDDHIQVMEILCAYIRQNALAQKVALPEQDDPTPEQWWKWAETGRHHPRDDIAVAITIIERRGAAQKQREELTKYRLDLRRAPLGKFILTLKCFEKALFQSAALQGAVLGWAELQGAYLGWAKLQGADLGSAELQGADLRSAEFDASTDLTAALLRGAAVKGVDFTDVNIEPEQIDAMFGDGSVTLPKNIARPGHWAADKLDYVAFKTAWRAWQREIGFEAEEK